MNRIYKSKWNSALGAWVACSETTNRVGKTKSIALASAAMLATSFSFAQGTCGTYTNDVINPNFSCDQRNVDGSTFSSNGGLLFAGAGIINRNIVIISPDVTVGLPSARKPYTTAGAAISPQGWDATTAKTNTVSGNNVALYLTGSSAGTYSYGGVGVAYGGQAWLNNFTLDVANANNGDLNGLMAGAPFGSGQPNGARLGLKNYIHVAGDYNFNAVKSVLTNTNPTTGIRSILNNNGQSAWFGTIAGEYGPQPIVTVDGKYTANITSGYGNGVYVSGKWDQASSMPIVNLNDTNITITGNGNALKIGKKDRSISGIRQYRDGWGAGQLNFKDGATVNIDQSNATGEAIAVTYGGSVLNAAGTAAFNVVSQGNSIRVGNDILTNAVQPSTDLININIANANFRTITPTSSLIRVDPQQQNVALQFTGAKTDLTAPSDGYIIDVQGTGAQFSKASLTLDQGASMTGLTNKTSDSTLNIVMANGSTWNLAEKSTGAVATSNFNTLDMSTSSTLNAFKASGGANFVMNGAVNSVSSTINMQNPSGAIAGDNLSINGNYTGTEGALNLDTALGDDASITDKLTVTGNTSGSTEIDVLNAAGAGAMTGAGIKVVQVDGNSAATDFTLKNGIVYAQAPSKQKFEYRLYQGLNGGIPSWFTNLISIDPNDWYLRSTCVDGSNTTGGTSTGTDALGCLTPDTIVVQDSAVVGKVEGAGGADTISILGNASVTGDVLGGANGLDMSAAQDIGDTITINTTGSIGGNVDGSLGDDVISVQAGTIAGSVLGGEDNDKLTVTGTSTVAGIMDGGNGNDTMEWSGSSSLGGAQGGAGSDTLTVSSTQYNGSQLLDGGDDTSVADGQIDTLTLNGVTATTNGSTIVNWEVIKLDQGTKLTLDGTLTTGSGTDSAGNPMGLSVDNTSALLVGPTTATVTGDVANAGTIDLHTNNTNPVNSLTINGNYTGTNGTVLMDTALGNDSSATDSIHVTGNTSGTTNLSIFNAGGTGAITTNGIPVVQVDGTSADGSFLLLNNTPLSINGFDYYLYKGLPDGSGNSWYLRSLCSNGSNTTGGSSSGTDALGCAPNDTIVVQDNAVLNKIEGAGGADTISVLGNASVLGDVLGGGQGKDNSAATDMGDTITINTTGSIGGNVDGGIGDDTITVQAGTVKGSVIGGEGNDTLTVTGTSSVAGAIDGGNGNDTITVSGASTVDQVLGGAGNDTMAWSGSSSVASVSGGAGSDTLTVSSSKYNGSQLLDGGDDTSTADGQIDTLNLNGVTATTNGSTIINWEVMKLNQGTRLTLDGALTTGSGADAAGNPMGLAIDSSSTLATGSTATVTGDVTNAGTIDLHSANTAPVNALTINGNYTGKSGSKLLVDSTWNNTNSLTTDSLTINGSASGSTAVSVPGGIFGDVTQAEQAKVSDKPVVTVSNAHAETVFTGSAPTSNAGEAQLLKVGNNYHWTLLAKAKPTDPTPTIPIYDEPVSAYVQTPLVNKEMGFAQMGKLHERVSEQQTWAWDDCGTRCEQYQQFKDKDQKKYPVWGRLNGEYLKLQGDNRFALRSKSGFVQFGVDIDNQVNLQDGSRRHNGAMLTYGWGSTDFFDKNRAQNGVVVADKYTGKADTDMLSLGGYSTWYGKNGTYLDLVGNVSWLRNKYRSRDGAAASQNGYGLGLSAEVGRPWRIGESQWQIEPQAQLSYQHIHLNGFNDGVREVSGQNLNGLRGRAGARLAWNAQAEQLRTKTFYLTANVLHDFKGNTPSATLGRDEVQDSYGRTWGEVGIGGQTALSKATYLYGDVRYQRSLDGNKGALGGARREGYHGRIGVRHTW